MRVVAELTAVHQEIARLEAALTGAEARSKQQAKAQQIAAQAAVRARVGKLLDERLSAVTRIETAVTDLVKGWRELIQLSDKAFVAFPNGPPPSGTALTNAELIQLRRTRVPLRFCLAENGNRNARRIRPPDPPGIRWGGAKITHRRPSPSRGELRG
jgi:hypothetical protein